MPNLTRSGSDCFQATWNTPSIQTGSGKPAICGCGVLPRRQHDNLQRMFHAGSKPSGYVHPLAVRVMQELEIDISSHTSKSLDVFRGEGFDLDVTVCDNAKESCPVFPGARRD